MQHTNTFTKWKNNFAKCKYKSFDLGFKGHEMKGNVKSFHPSIKKGIRNLFYVN